GPAQESRSRQLGPRPYILRRAAGSPESRKTGPPSKTTSRQTPCRNSCRFLRSDPCAPPPESNLLPPVRRKSSGRQTSATPLAARATPSVSSGNQLYVPSRFAGVASHITSIFPQAVL